MFVTAVPCFLQRQLDIGGNQIRHPGGYGIVLVVGIHLARKSRIGVRDDLDNICPRPLKVDAKTGLRSTEMKLIHDCEE